MALKVNWAEVKRLWALGTLSNNALAEQFGMAESTLRARIKKENWQRDLSEDVRLKREAKMRMKAVLDKAADLSDEELTDSEAEIQTQILMDEREEIDRLREAARQTEEEILELIRKSPKDKAQEIAEKRIRLTELEKAARTLRTLVETRRVLIDMRRRNYGINDNANGDANKEKNPMSELFAALSGNVIGVTAQLDDDDE
jgi:hypothetical protein